MTNTKSGYQLRVTQSYDTIPREVALRVSPDNPQLSEVRFVKEAGKELMYETYVLEGEIPAPINKCEFVAAGKAKELSDVLIANLIEGALPYEIRVIHPQPKQDYWGMFIQRLNYQEIEACLDNIQAGLSRIQQERARNELKDAKKLIISNLGSICTNFWFKKYQKI